MDGAFLMFAEALLDAGYSPLPVIPGRKKPALKGWSNCCETPLSRERIRDYAGRWPKAGLGLALGYGGVLALDIDTIDGRQIEAVCSTLPPSPVAKMGEKGFTRYYRAPAGVAMPPRHYSARFSVKPGQCTRRSICDLLSAGSNCGFRPRLHPSGHAYRWLTAGTLLTVPAHGLPEAPRIYRRGPGRRACALEAERAFRGLQHTEPLARRRGLSCGGSPRSLRPRLAAGRASSRGPLRAGGTTRCSPGLCPGARQHHDLLDGAGIGAIAACGLPGQWADARRWEAGLLATLRNGIAWARDDPLPALRERTGKNEIKPVWERGLSIYLRRVRK